MIRTAVRRCLSVSALATVVALLVTPAAATGSAALPDDTVTPSPIAAGDGLPVAVGLNRLEPRAPQPGARLVLSGSARAVGPLALRDLSVRLRVSSVPVHTRDELAQLAADVHGPLAGGVRGSARTSISVDHLARGQSASWQVQVSVNDLHLPEPWMVYKIGIEVVGCSDNGCGTLGRLRSFLPWAPLGPGSATPSRIAWVWPLADRPHRGGASAWLDDDLAAEFAPGGRLSGLVRSAVAVRSPVNPRAPATPRGAKAQPRVPVLPVPVTWAVDPMLVEDADLMSAGYQVAPDGSGKPTPGKGKEAAAAWLRDLRQAVAGEPVIALPYADADATALVHSGLTDDLRLAMTSGQKLAGRLLGTPLLDDVAWPVAGLADQRTLDVFFGSRIDIVVLAESALPLRTDPGRTPGARATVSTRDGSLTGLLVDEALRRIVEGGSKAEGGARVAEQRFLAETLLISAEAPSIQRDIVVAPDRRWQPNVTYVGALLTDTGRVPWLQPVTLRDVAADPQPEVQRGPLTYPVAAHAAELPADYLSGVRDLRASLDGLAAVLPPADPLIRDLDTALFRSESAAYRGDLARAYVQRDSVASALEDARAKVRIASAPGSLVTLTSRSGKVPVTIANDLDSPAKVVLRLDAGERLSIAGAGSLVQVLPPHRQVTVEVSARARTAGVFPLTVSLETPQVPGQELQKVELLVRSTVYGTVALTITGAAAAVLFLAVFLRLIRRAVRARRSARAAG